MQITTIGLDIAKNVFQVHGIDAGENVVVRKQLRRGGCRNAMSAFMGSVGGQADQPSDPSFPGSPLSWFCLEILDMNQNTVCAVGLATQLQLVGRVQWLGMLYNIAENDQ
jgi:hypothetical protein